MKWTRAPAYWLGQYNISGLQHEDGKPSSHFLLVMGFRVNINRTLVSPVVNQLDRYLSILPSFPSNMLTRGKGRVAERVQPSWRCSKGTCMFAVAIALICNLSIIQENVIRTHSTEIFRNVGIKCYRIIWNFGARNLRTNWLLESERNKIIYIYIMNN